jgi:cysteine desulfurase/selenocysteine lyase
MRKGRGVYLDSACQSLRPDSVIRAMTEYYEEYPGCGGRSVHEMSARISLETDETREKLASFFGTKDPNCYIFTKNTTESINTVAFGFGLKKDDAVVTTDTEHNSNHVPWLVLADAVGIKKRHSESGADGEFNIENFKSCMNGDVKLVSVHHASNVTGCLIPVKDVAEIAHDRGAKVLIDGSQAAPHMKVDLGRIGADFYAVSMHKMLGPSGMGVMYGTSEALEGLRPLTYGGGTVGLATYDHANMAPVPERFESGLQNYSGIVGAKAAIEYLDGIGMENVAAQDRRLMRRLMDGVSGIEGLRIVGPSRPDRRTGAFSFNIDMLGSHDVAMMLDKIDRIMIRSGMHCAHPFYESRGIDGSARASVYLYNNDEDVDRFAKALIKVAGTFGSH